MSPSPIIGLIAGALALVAYSMYLQQKIVENAMNYGKKYGIDIDADFALLQ